jgi:hypothetical protein
MTKKPCKECPWVVENRHNQTIKNHSIKHEKRHNCHMISYEKSGGLWDIKKEYQCVGNKQYMG